MNRIELVHRLEAHPQGITHWVDLAGLGRRVIGPRAIYWRLQGVHDAAPHGTLDHFLLAVLLPLATMGGEVRVRGAMTRAGLFNALRLLEIRRATSPGRYRPLRIVPDVVIDLPPPDPGDRRAVLAFSGGLDSTHAALRHADAGDRPDALQLAALVMAHGFDAPLDRPDIFARMLERAAPLAARLGIPLHAVETNSKHLQPGLWPQTATPLAAAMLSLFEPIARIGVFGGGLPYGSNFLTLGHQPLFDQHCSGGAFRMVTDAAGLSRLQKLRNISADRVALMGLRTCWQGPDVSKNCGTCKKCLLTKLNMRMAGLDETMAFDTPLDPAQLGSIIPPTLYDARDVAEYAWVEMRHDPALAVETRIIGERLAMVPPTSVPAAIMAAIWQFLVPASLRRMLTETNRLRRGAMRRVARVRRRRGYVAQP